MEEAVENAVSSSPNPNDLSNIVKGKRTKRMRPHSPVPSFNVAPLSHSSSINNCNIIINYSPPSMEEEEEGGGTAVNINNQVDEEDEEMANCLILLSQGNPVKNSPNYNNGGEKFTSKRYIETPISSNGKAGMYVYQCKTCGRTFPSFQALGGHRASHKKPKNTAATAEAKKVSELLSAFAFSDDEEEAAFMIKNYKSKKPPTLSLELSNWNCEFSNSEVKNKSPHHQLKKIHECSYCGAQFSSGQALGGHMRRHRGMPVTAVAPATPSTNTTLSLSPFPISPASINQDSSDQDDEGKKIRNELSLDLNLPAPEDHDHHLHSKETNSALLKKHQQIQHKKPQPETKPELGPDPNLVLSTGRFVECRY